MTHIVSDCNSLTRVAAGITNSAIVTTSLTLLASVALVATGASCGPERSATGTTGGDMPARIIIIHGANSDAAYLGAPGFPASGTRAAATCRSPPTDGGKGVPRTFSRTNVRSPEATISTMPATIGMSTTSPNKT